MENISLAVPRIPTAHAAILFILLFALLAQKEILRPFGRPASSAWQSVSNWLIGVTFVLYGFVLLFRFLSFFV
jgi:hypothetical protein